MDDFAYSRVQNWLDKDYLFDSAVKFAKKISRSSARVAAVAALFVASATQIAFPVESSAGVAGYSIPTAVHASAEIHRSSLDRAFSDMDALMARLDGEETGFSSAALSSMAHSAAASIEANKMQSPKVWAELLAANIKPA